MKTTHLLAAALLPLSGVLSAATAHAAAEAGHPNIVYILADDLGYGDVRCLNPDRGKILTPHLDELSSEELTFTDAHSGSSVCTPTRYGLLTGRYAWRTRLRKGVLGGCAEPLISNNTLARALCRQGARHQARLARGRKYPSVRRARHLLRSCRQS